jgi:ABC-type polar amino acid transport system ATPase subunit
MLTGRAISQQYGESKVLDAVTIAVERGSITAVVGKSGSGKSTLLRALSLVDPPSEGSVIVDDKVLFPVRSAALRAVWPMITLVFQQLYLWPHLTVAENIHLPAKRLRRPADLAPSIVAQLAIDHLLTRYPGQISTGERQRVALARALLLRPEYLFLDEITSSQDVHHVKLIYDVLSTAMTSGIGLLVVSHHLGFVRQLISLSKGAQIVCMENGQIVESGGIESLNHPRSAELGSYVTLSQTLG